MINGDRIRQMSDEELAKFLSGTVFCDLFCGFTESAYSCTKEECEKSTLDYLKQERRTI